MSDEKSKNFNIFTRHYIYYKLFIFFLKTYFHIVCLDKEGNKAVSNYGKTYGNIESKYLTHFLEKIKKKIDKEERKLSGG